MKRFRLALQCAALGVVLLALACGSGIGADQACADWAKAACAKLDECRHSGTQIAYGTLSQCIARQQANCVAILGSPAVGNDPGFYKACALALPGESCQDYLQDNPVADCTIKSGHLENATPCTYSTQCQSGFCALVDGTDCGTCQNPPSPDDPCTNTGCARNQICTPSQVCEIWVASGVCDGKVNICAPGMACVIPTGKSSGLCQARAATVGSPCDPRRVAGPDCDPNAGLYCDAMTLKCVAESYSSTTCGLSNSGHTFTLCTGGGGCSSAACIPAVDAGGACDTALGPPCLAPARCVTGGGAESSGICRILDAAMCK